MALPTGSNQNPILWEIEMQAVLSRSTPSRAFHLDPSGFEDITRGKSAEKVAAFRAALADLDKFANAQRAVAQRTTGVL